DMVTQVVEPPDLAVVPDPTVKVGSSTTTPVAWRRSSVWKRVFSFRLRSLTYKRIFMLLSVVQRRLASFFGFSLYRMGRINMNRALFAAGLVSVCIVPQARAQVKFSYDSTRASGISVNGVQLVTGNGSYLVGSKDGTDDPKSNYSSVGSNGA